MSSSKAGKASSPSKPGPRLVEGGPAPEASEGALSAQPCPECQALKSIITELLEERRSAPVQATASPPAAAVGEPLPLRYRVVDAVNDRIKRQLGFVHPFAKRLVSGVLARVRVARGSPEV